MLPTVPLAFVCEENTPTPLCRLIVPSAVRSRVPRRVGLELVEESSLFHFSSLMLALGLWTRERGVPWTVA